MKRQAFSVSRGIIALSAMAVASCLVSTARAFVTRPIVRSFLLREPCRHFVASSVQCRAYAKGRPSIDDVERLSRGQAAKKRGTGSRNICHRLNEMERKEFELAKKMGFVQLRGTGYRRERKGSPLANIHRQLCDATGRPCIEIHRGLGTDVVDEVIVDLSTLRPGDDKATALLHDTIQVLEAVRSELLPERAEAPSSGEAEEGSVLTQYDEARTVFSEDDWDTKPIWELPALCYVYNCTGDRALAKRLAQEVHDRTAKLSTSKR